MKLKEFYQLRDGEFRTLKNGKFQQSYVGEFEKNEYYCNYNSLNIYPVQRQSVFGFGACLNESMAYNYSLLSKANKEKTLEALFGNSGLKTTFFRIHIGSCDYSVKEYTLVEEEDYELKSFNIEYDKKYIIPMLKDVVAFVRSNGREPYFLASPWTPPPFMKTNGSYVQGKLKKECYSVFAKYVVKFIEEYKKEGIIVSAVTIENEADAGTPWESCRYTPQEEAEYAERLYDELKKVGHEVKILCMDHNKGGIYDYASVEFPILQDKLWGVAFHYYDGTHFDELELVRTLFPDKIMLATELSEGLNSLQPNIFKEMIGDLNHGASGFQDWCMLLDEEGGPFHNRPFGSNSLLVFDRNEKTVKKHNRWYKEYMFSHFIENGAKVLATSSYDDGVYICAVKNPDGKIVAVLYNSHNYVDKAMLKTPTENLKIDLYPNTCYTLIIEDDHSELS